MNDKPTKNSSVESDWGRIDAMTDDEIDTSDIPSLDEDFFQRARIRMPKKSVTVHIDADLLQWFREQGGDYEQRMNAALRLYVEVHKAA